MLEKEVLKFKENNNYEENYENKILFEELINNFDLELLEARTKRQQELGEFEMAKKELDPIYKIRNYVKNKWTNRPKTKEEYKKMKEEFLRLQYIISVASELILKNDKRMEQYIKDISKVEPKWDIRGNRVDQFTQDKYSKYPYITINTDLFYYGNGFKVDDKNLADKKVLKRFIINHEYGHLYEYLKKFIEGDNNPKIVDTMNGDTKEVLDSEGKANAYAFDNMSRKQRMDFIKRTKENKESFNKSNKNIKKSLDEKSDILASDLYKAGLSKHSKTLEKTLDSIEKENKYFNY